jgi:hypothetical protein
MENRQALVSCRPGELLTVFHKSVQGSLIGRILATLSHQTLRMKKIVLSVDDDDGCCTS